MYSFFLKRVIDFITSFFVLLVFSPLVVILTLFLAFANNGKPFFVQNRPGKSGKIFKIIKFKTMNDKKDRHGNLLSDAERLTKLGSFIRKTSLDEIPQLINVLKGDMSLIGPRPLLPEYLFLYNDFQKQIDKVNQEKNEHWVQAYTHDFSFQ